MTEQEEKRIIDLSFQYAESIIQQLTGLTLKLSELVRLRQLVNETWQTTQDLDNNWNCSYPHTDAVYRFLAEYYDINCLETGTYFDDETCALWSLLEVSEQRDGLPTASQRVKEYFKIRQDEMYLL